MACITSAGLIFLPQPRGIFQQPRPEISNPRLSGKEYKKYIAKQGQDKKWAWYNDREKARKDEHSLLLYQAISTGPAPDAPKYSLDLGCGTGAVTRELRMHGYHVTAIDTSTRGLVLLRAMASHAPQQIPGIQTDNSRFEDFSWASVQNQMSLIATDHALPFCHPDIFPRVWEGITQALRPGGMFVGNIFGDRHEWKDWKDEEGKSNPLTLIKPIDLQSMLNRFYILVLNEQEGLGLTKKGTEINWHRYHIIAVKKPDHFPNTEFDKFPLFKPK